MWLWAVAGKRRPQRPPTTPLPRQPRKKPPRHRSVRAAPAESSRAALAARAVRASLRQGRRLALVAGKAARRPAPQWSRPRSRLTPSRTRVRPRPAPAARAARAAPRTVRTSAPGVAPRRLRPRELPWWLVLLAGPRPTRPRRLPVPRDDAVAVRRLPTRTPDDASPSPVGLPGRAHRFVRCARFFFQRPGYRRITPPCGLLSACDCTGSPTCSDSCILPAAGWRYPAALLSTFTFAELCHARASLRFCPRQTSGP